MSGNPLSATDTTGLLEDFTYELNSQPTSQLKCECGDTYQAFSGSGAGRNDPRQASNSNVGPIPPGVYYIVDRPTGGRVGALRDFFRPDKADWFALYKKDGIVDDQTTIDGVLRGAFRLHYGSLSEGCITLSDKNAYARLYEKLRSTQTATIPGTGITYYGTVTVK